MTSANSIYTKLMKKYSSQGWWPITPNRKLHPEHSGQKPQTDKQRFEIIIGAILTQNTSWSNVEKAIYQLNVNKLISPEGILAIPKKKLAEVIKSSGYFNQKAEKLKIIAKLFYYTKMSQLMQLETAELREFLLKIKGIGPETADSILLYAFEKESFVVDAYTKRIFSRIGLTQLNNSYDELQAYFHKHVKKDLHKYKEYHALIVQHAKQYCKAKPKCKDCFLNKICIYGKEIVLK